MGNVFQFPTGENTRDMLQPANLLRGLYGLWASRVLSQDAFFLGAQVCHRMIRDKVTQVILTGEEAQNTVTRMSNTIYSGPIGKSLHMYVAALQDLHFRGALLNDLSESALYDPDNMTKHFTLSPTKTAGRHYSFRTPIYFRILPVSTPEFVDLANKLAASSLMACETLDF